MEEFVIPEELLANILVRLPLKDLSRSKLVCKSWLRLISSSSDPYFRINYARNYNDVPNNMLSYFLIEFPGKGGEKTHHHYIPITPPHIPDYHPGPDSRLSFIGWCDCSVFLLHRKHFDRVYSYDPVSGSCVKLVAYHKIENWQYKVGFIPSNNTYKLLRFVPGFEKAKKAEIFTVGGLDDENWRKLDDNDPLLFCGAYDTVNPNGRLICFNGAFHWVSSSDHDRIFTFNLLEEKSGTRIPKPHDMSQRLSVVTIIDDRLSVADLSADDLFSGKMVIWTMREYGVVESWSKFAVLPYHTFDERSICIGLVPIAVLANGDILFNDTSSKSGLCFYNIEEKRLTQIERKGPWYVPRFCT